MCTWCMYPCGQSLNKMCHCVPYLVPLESGKACVCSLMIGPLLLEYRKIELRQEGKKDTKSPEEVCRPDFSSSSMVTGQVAGWCVGRDEAETRDFSWSGKFFSIEG